MTDWDAACESGIAADYESDPFDGICRSCGYDDPCGCPMDINTMAKMSCPSCGGQWWRSWGDASTRCLHRQCKAEGSVVIREPLYAPHDPESTPGSPGAKEN